MSLDILREIRFAEEEAENKRKKSLSEANEILTEAKKEAYLIIEKEIEDAEREAEQMILKAEKSANDDIEQVKNSVNDECSKMKIDTTKKFDEAVNLIAERIVKLHDS